MKNRFWCFVQYFWICHGSMGYDDEWHAEPGRFYADLIPEVPKKQSFNSICKNFSARHFLKVSFPYHLELSRRYTKKFKITRGYYLTIEIRLSTYQKETVARYAKVTSKKEAIRKTLQIIKEFESNKRRVRETWRKLRYKMPIVNDKGKWIATVIVGHTSRVFQRSSTFCSIPEAPLGYGDFYVLERCWGNRENWSWSKYSISSWGYSSSGCSSVPFHIWKGILGFNLSLDLILEQAIRFQQKNKFVMLNDKNGEAAGAELLNDFYRIQRNLP